MPLSPIANRAISLIQGSPDRDQWYFTVPKSISNKAELEALVKDLNKKGFDASIDYNYRDNYEATSMNYQIIINRGNASPHSVFTQSDSGNLQKPEPISEEQLFSAASLPIIKALSENPDVNQWNVVFTDDQISKKNIDTVIQRLRSEGFVADSSFSSEGNPSVEIKRGTAIPDPPKPGYGTKSKYFSLHLQASTPNATVKPAAASSSTTNVSNNVSSAATNSPAVSPVTPPVTPAPPAASPQSESSAPAEKTVNTQTKTIINMAPPPTTALGAQNSNRTPTGGRRITSSQPTPPSKSVYAFDPTAEPQRPKVEDKTETRKRLHIIAAFDKRIEEYLSEVKKEYRNFEVTPENFKTYTSNLDNVQKLFSDIQNAARKYKSTDTWSSNDSNIFKGFKEQCVNAVSTFQESLEKEEKNDKSFSLTKFLYGVLDNVKLLVNIAVKAISPQSSPPFITQENRRRNIITKFSGDVENIKTGADTLAQYNPEQLQTPDDTKKLT